MAVIEVVINGKPYRIGCIDGEENKIKRDADVLNSRIKKFKDEDPDLFASLTNDKMLMLLSFTLLEELEEKSQKQEIPSNRNNLSNNNQENYSKIIEIANAKISSIESSLTAIEEFLKKFD